MCGKTSEKIRRDEKMREDIKIKRAKKRIGKTNIASNGMKMIIIAYYGSDNMDVRFEDGTVIHNVSYENFKKGYVKNPNFIPKTDHTGKTNIAKNGMQMTVVAYRRYNDIDVQFKDGTIARHKSYGNFKRGYIAHPSVREKNPDVLSYIHRIGEKNVAKNGLEMEIIGYRNCHDIDIKFEDDVVVYHKTYYDFENGNVLHPSRPEKLGKTNIASNGIKMTIVAYRNCNDIDVQFEDGVIVQHKTYDSFKNGCIKHPTKGRHIGEKGVTRTGRKMTIIIYRNYEDMDIMFEDGTIVYNKSYKSFKKGQVKHPSEEESRIGEVRTAKNGMKMIIVDYRKSTDIDVEFEDGYLACNKTYSSFKDGNIRHPHTLANQRIGEVRKNSEGYLMKIKDYRFGTDVDIEFEDGTVLYHKNYYQFKQGAIRKPNNKIQGRNINGN